MVGGNRHEVQLFVVNVVLLKVGHVFRHAGRLEHIIDQLTRLFWRLDRLVGGKREHVGQKVGGAQGAHACFSSYMLHAKVPTHACGLIAYPRAEFSHSCLRAGVSARLAS